MKGWTEFMTQSWIALQYDRELLLVRSRYHWKKWPLEMINLWLLSCLTHSGRLEYCYMLTPKRPRYINITLFRVLHPALKRGLIFRVSAMFCTSQESSWRQVQVFKHNSIGQSWHTSNSTLFSQQLAVFSIGENELLDQNNAMQEAHSSSKNCRCKIENILFSQIYI